MEQHYENQRQNWIYFKNNIKEHAEISVDNWLMKLHAYKNKDTFSERHKRHERYLKWSTIIGIDHIKTTSKNG